MEKETRIVQTKIKNNTWIYLSDAFRNDGRADIANLITANRAYIREYCNIKYGTLEVTGEIYNASEETIANVVYLDIMDSFPRIYDALKAEYDPLENYYTNRSYNEEGSGSNTKSGGYTDKPSGTVKVNSTGSREKTYNNLGSVNQGTTFESASTDPSANDFHNISKNIVEGSEVDSFNNFGSETSYNNYQNQRTYNALKDEANASKSGREHRDGNSGIFSKQDLTQREINLRLRNRIVPILVRMVIDVVNNGVWHNGKWVGHDDG